jgi:hypothetical protein
MAQPKRSFLERAVRLAKFAGRGAVLPAMDNPNIPGQKADMRGYSPVGVDMAPVAFYNLANMIPGVKIQNDYLDEASARTQLADEKLGQFLGIGEPENAAELVANVVGGLLVPAGGPTKLAKAAAAAKTASAVRQVPKGVKLAKSVVRGVAEAAVPLRQGKLVSKTTGAIAALPTAAYEVIDAQTKGTGYKSIREYITGKEDVALEDIDPSMLVDADEEQEPIPASTAIDPATLVDADEEQQDAEISDIDPASLEPVEDQPLWKHPAVQGAMILSAIGLGVSAPSIIKGITKRRLSSSSALTGVTTEPQFTTKADLLKGKTVQGDQALRAVADMMPDPRLMNSKLDAVVATSMNGKVRHALRAGELPNSSINIGPLAAKLEAFAKSTDEADRVILSDGLLARTVLDDIKAGRPRSAFEVGKDGKPITEADLTAMATRLETDTRMNTYANMVKDQYRQILDYKVEQGAIDAATAATMRAARPNYVKLSKNDKAVNNRFLFGLQDNRSSMDNSLNRFYARSEEAGAGVQAGSVRDPVAELISEWHKAIREVEINRVRKDILTFAESNPELSKYVKRIPGQPKADKGIHGVMVNGKQEFFKVKDLAISDALMFSPNSQRSTLSVLLALPKRLKQATTTGALAPGFAPVSAYYDTVTSMINLEKGMTKGIINEGLNYLGGPNIGRFDPTVWIEPITGALRLGGDKIIEAMADGLTTELLQEGSALVNLLGRSNVQTYRNLFSKLYAGTVKAKMDEFGALSTNTFDGADPTRLSSGMSELAPEFSSQVAARAFQEAKEGGMGFAEGILRRSQNVYEQAKAAQLARLYTSVVKTIHEGPRYATFATNLPKFAGSAEDLQYLSTAVRRASGDTGQIGNSAALQDFNNAALFLNSSVQPVAQIARRLGTDPAHTLWNMVGVVTGMIALTYGAAAINPEIAARRREMTDGEKLKYLPTVGGLEIPIDPAMRMITAPLFAILDEVSGINSGNFDPNFAHVMERWLEGDDMMSEEALYSSGHSFREALKTALPFDPLNPIGSMIGAVPAANAAMISQGFNPGMTRYTDNPMMITSQGVTGLGGDGDLSGDALSSTTEAIINELMGGIFTHTLRSVQDFNRATGNGDTAYKALDVALSRLGDETVKGAGPTREMLFGNYEKLQSYNTPIVELWYKKVDGMEKAKLIHDKDWLNGFVTGQNPRYAMARPIDTVPQDLQNTMLLPVLMINAELQKGLRDGKARLAALKEVADDYKNQRSSTIEARNINMNDINDQRREVIEEMMLNTKQAEEAIRMQTGDDTFTFQNFDPEKYKAMPYPPVSPIMPQAEVPAQ